MKPFILCADDYGLSQPINEAILELIQLGRLQATSCMVTGDCFLSGAPLLKPYIDKVQIGLHFNLTEGSPLTHLPEGHFGSLKKLLIRSHLHRLNRHALEKEFEAQLNFFMQTIGKAPTFIDGHQYIHQFPVIREVILYVYQRTFKDVKPYIRVPANSVFSTISQSLRQPKVLLVALTGAFSLRRRLKVLGIPCNTTFSGIYDFSTRKPYSELFSKFITHIDDHGLIVCHPAKPSNYITHGIDDARVKEYLYLKGK